MNASPAPLFETPVRVYWEDTDAGGVVYYANYLRFFERARTEWLRAIGLSQEVLRCTHERLFLVTEAQLRYLAPARLDDALRITVEQPVTAPASVSLTQRAWRGQTLLVQASIRVACVHAQTLRPQRLPQPLLETLP